MFLQPPRPSTSTLRARYTLQHVRSKRRRLPAERAVLDEHGQRAAVYELQGDLRFSTIEQVLREIVNSTDGLEFAVLDFKRVTYVDLPATRMLAALVGSCAARGQHLVLTRVRRGDLLAEFSNELAPHSARSVSFQPQLDLGLEWCERGLLERYAQRAPTAAMTGLAEHRWCAGATPEDIADLEARVERCQFEAGATIVRRGDAADALYFLMRGEVSVIVALAQGGFKRLSTLSAGMGFGESALTAGGVRSADVRADTEVQCCTLSASAFARLEHERPSLVIRLLRNLMQGSNETAVRLTAEVAALEG